MSLLFLNVRHLIFNFQKYSCWLDFLEKEVIHFKGHWTRNSMTQEKGITYLFEWRCHFFEQIKY